MIKQIYQAALAITLCFGCLPSAFAVSPYFGQIENIDHPDFGPIKFAVLYGDGIFFADPSQVVVFDKDGYLLASTAISYALTIHCDRSIGTPKCFVFSESDSLIFEPDYKKWTRKNIIAENDEPQAYPDSNKIEFGFNQRSASLNEKTHLLVASVLNAPIASLLSIVWWSLAWSLIANLFWQWKRCGWQIWPIKWNAVFSGVVNISVFLVMVWLAVMTYLQQFYSEVLWMLQVTIGTMIAIIFTRPKKVNSGES